MKNITLPIASDTILSGFITFIFASVILRPKIVSDLALYSLSAVFAVCVLLLVFSFLKKRNQVSTLKSDDRKRIESVLLNLELMPDNQLIALFSSIFDKSGTEYYSFANKIETDDCSYVFDFSAKTRREKIVQAIRSANGKKVVYFCNTPDDDCRDLCDRLGRKLVVKDRNVIPLLEKKYGITFPVYDDEKDETAKKSIAGRALSKVRDYFARRADFKRALTLALSGTGIILFSKFSFFPKWYVLTGLILLILSAIITGIRIFAKRSDESSLPL